ncbi:MAG TPA: hypothetical protein V6C84_16160 [Coleofasciculaceae cyanobacterium]|jgi:tRNA(Ile)-lysidine synthase TilS/MesJ
MIDASQPTTEAQEQNAQAIAPQGEAVAGQDQLLQQETTAQDADLLAEAAHQDQQAEAVLVQIESGKIVPGEATDLF